MSQISNYTTTWKESHSASEHDQLLSSARRRLTVEILAEAESPTTLADLAAAVANREFDGAEETDRKRVATALHHVHLPALDDCGAVDYDPDSHRVDTA